MAIKTMLGVVNYPLAEYWVNVYQNADGKQWVGEAKGTPGECSEATRTVQMSKFTNGIRCVGRLHVRPKPTPPLEPVYAKSHAPEHRPVQRGPFGPIGF